MKYKVNLKKSEEGYAVWVPGLPGCWSQGRTEEESLENIKDAIQSYLKTVVKCNKYPVNPVNPVKKNTHKSCLPSLPRR